MRGDLHMHTSWSDGRDTVEAMVTEGHRLGYEYLAITDHSPNAGTSRTLTIDGVKPQADEIAAMRERFPSMAIFHGCEVDILPDGRLDFPDRVLEKFDIVLASLHDSAGQDADHLEKRYMSAMKHPLVTLITHPTNRILPHRRGYKLDYERLFATAVETGTFMEIDGAPSHLDMDGALARRALAAGVTVTIDSDSHRAEMLGRQMELGVATARRGWVEPKHVLNTRPAAEVRALMRNGRVAPDYPRRLWLLRADPGTRSSHGGCRERDRIAERPSVGVHRPATLPLYALGNAVCGSPPTDLPRCSTSHRRSKGLSRAR
jgi:DNA polymerase (family 10)